MLPFDNIKVIDLTTRAPGPFCSMALADMGAEVVLVEAPAGVGSQGGPGPDEVREAAFDPLRRNKRSIVLDLKDPGARQALYDLAAGADVFMEGFKPGTVKRLGADYETLRGVNERLVYCSLSGYGQDGPYRSMPGHDVNYISFAGVLGSMGSPDGTPVIPNNIIADFAAGGLLGAFSIVTALWARERTGRGQYVDLSLTDGSVYLNAMVMKNFFLHGEKNRPGQAPLNGASPDYRVYRCKDGRFLSVGSLEFKFWRTLCEALERPDWVDRRRSEPAAVAAEMDARFAERTRDEWFDLLGGLDLAIGKVYDVDEAPGDPQLRHRGMFVEVEAQGGLTATQVGIPTKLSETPGSIRNEGPPAGRDTRAVLAEIGRTQDQIEALIASGAARQFAG